MPLWCPKKNQRIFPVNCPIHCPRTWEKELRLESSGEVVCVRESKVEKMMKRREVRK